MTDYNPTRDAAVTALRGLGVSIGAANGIVRDWPDLSALADASPEDLASHGVKRAQAARIAAAFRLVRLADAVRGEDRSLPVRDPGDVTALLRATYGDRDREHFAVLYLDARQRVIRHHVIAIGSLSQVDVHPREVFAVAVQRPKAHSVILCHNHPSGSPDPSAADIRLTERMAEAGRLLGVPVLDHVIVTAHDSMSLQALGLVPAA